MVAADPAVDGSLLAFIENNHEAILMQWEHFARSIPSARHLQSNLLRDHAEGMLLDIAAALKGAPAPAAQGAPADLVADGPTDTQAELHGAGRQAAGFTVSDTIAEFRALRASVLQLWTSANTGAPALGNGELTRFNALIDKALAESVERFGLEKDEYTRRFDTLLSSSPDLHFIIGPDARLIYANQALCKRLGLAQDALVGSNLGASCPALAARIASDLGKVNSRGEPLRAEVRLPDGDGEDVTYRYVLLPVSGAHGNIDAIAGTARNISELKASEELIHRNAYYDSLTQLPNRALFHDRLEQGIKHAERTGQPLALMFIDLDGFKEVNDGSGHAAGDRLLQECARRIAACVRGSDTVARIGGDEFTVILTEINDLLHVEILAQAILEALARPFSIGPSNYFMSGSMGITLCPQDGQSPDALLRNADQAMYVAEQAGRNRFSFFTVEMRDSAWARLKTIDELRHALVRQQLEVYYQPIVELASGTIAKAEALVRWHHPQGMLVLPDAFIGLAEQTSLIGEIGSWVLGQAVIHARHWSAMLGRPFQISVNKSAVEFMSAAMVKSWESDLVALGMAREQIAVEITEGVLLKDSGMVRERLALLKQAGVQFTLDDFGIGYSSMSYLKKFKVDFLKIDQSFVKDMLQSPDSAVFAETIIVMAHKLGLKVIAEGVETVAQRDWLKAMHCDYAQGFLFSEAASAEGLTRMLEAAS